MEPICVYLKSVWQMLKKEIKENPVILSLILVLWTLHLPYIINSIALIFFALISIFSFKKKNWQVDKVLILPVVLYGLMILSLFWTLDMNASLKAITKDLPFLLVPCCLMINPTLFKNQKEKVLKMYSFGMLFFLFFYLIKAVVRYFQTGDSTVFFYHELVTEDLNAIHVSVYMALAFFYFYTQISKSFLNSIASVLLAFFIFLLSSKNIIVVLIILIILYEVRFSNRNLKLRNIILVGIILLGLGLLSMPKIRERFLIEYHSNTNQENVTEVNDLKNVNKVSVYQAWTQSKFNDNDYFAGTSFRVYQIRIFIEMLQEDPIFFTGYGLNATKPKIVKKGKEHTVFLGDATHDGYQNKNFHNQYIQMFAELGIFGLLLLLSILIVNIHNSIKRKNFIHIAFSILMISLFLTESFLSRQRGVVFFIVMYCFFNLNNIKHSHNN
jgi:O-antigen ligase